MHFRGATSNPQLRHTSTDIPTPCTAGVPISRVPSSHHFGFRSHLHHYPEARLVVVMQLQSMISSFAWCVLLTIVLVPSHHSKLAFRRNRLALFCLVTLFLLLCGSVVTGVIARVIELASTSATTPNAALDLSESLRDLFRSNGWLVHALLLQSDLYSMVHRINEASALLDLLMAWLMVSHYDITFRKTTAIRSGPNFAKKPFTRVEQRTERVISYRLSQW